MIDPGFTVNPLVELWFRICSFIMQLDWLF